jgi:hypothetical protein
VPKIRKNIFWPEEEERRRRSLAYRVNYCDFTYLFLESQFEEV